mgnify:CR=1 FL=1
MKWIVLALLLVFSLLVLSIAIAGEADVITVDVIKIGPNLYRFDVTVVHKDTGWDHYANKWDIVDPNGSVLGTRTLHHPHVNEQPFTRSLPLVEIPEDVKSVSVRAHDSQHSYGGQEVTIDLPD